MQPSFSLINEAMTNVEHIISPARLGRFSGTVDGDRNKALRLYVWNSRLCEEFYLPLQIAEISVRNNIHYTLTRRYTNQWYSNSAIVDQLTAKYKSELQKKVEERKRAKGKAFTVDHVVAGMTFGFWVNLLTSRYENLLWQQGMKRSFHCISDEMSRETVYKKVNQLRVFRNKVAHHYAIFDRRPSAEYQNIQDIVSWSCHDTLLFMKQVSNPSKIINMRPNI